MGIRICSIDGCNEKHKANGYCSMHLSRVIRHGDPNWTRPTICKVDGCASKYHSNGYCKKHWHRWNRYGDPLYTKKEMHGLSKTPEYRTWVSISQRCHNKNNKYYKNYGGRGIIVCDKWKDSFKAFLEDMGEKPFPKAEIDRKENDGNYEPGNCEWVAGTINRQHTRKTKINMQIAREIRRKHKQENIRIIELSRMYGLNSSNICNIIANKTWKEGVFNG